MTGHVCACPNCKADFYPHAERQHEGHVAGRFGDFDRVPRPRYHAMLDGVDVSKDCNEALAGDQGYVVVYSGCGPGKCYCRTCHKGACQEVRYGKVEIRTEVPA